MLSRVIGNHLIALGSTKGGLCHSTNLHNKETTLLGRKSDSFHFSRF